MILSGGSLVTKSPDIIWSGNTTQFDGALDILGIRWSSYSTMYRDSMWVTAAVNKIAGATARLPLKVYRRGTGGREDASDTPYGQIIAHPSKSVDPFTFWHWVRSALDIYGESFLGKVRDKGGRPVELVRLHPTFMKYDAEQKDWSYDNGRERVQKIPRRDLIHFRHFHPDSIRGMSPLEPLRQTIQMEDGTRRGFMSVMRNGGRPSVILQHPKILNDRAAERLALQWKDIHGGVDNWAKAAILEEGMTATALPVNFEELQYIDARKLNREEVCGMYDLPPASLQIMDRATFSNITENLRSLYRDSMAPKLGHVESVLEMELRDGSRGDGDPDFPADEYAEFLMDEVLRGAFEARAAAYQQSDFMTIAEKRQKENLPFIPGTDRIFLNSASLPLGPDGQLEQPTPEPPPPQLALPPAPKSLSDEVRTVMGRLSRVKSLDDIDTDALTAGLNGHTDFVLDALAQSDSVDAFKALLKEVT